MTASHSLVIIADIYGNAHERIPTVQVGTASKHKYVLCLKYTYTYHLPGGSPFRDD